MKKYLLIATLGILFSTQCPAQDWQPVVTTTDLFVWRPLSFAGGVAGSALWVASLPFTLPSKSHGKVFNVMVKRPFQYTFERPVADISQD